MKQHSVGHSGLRVSALGLGTMTWGRDTDEYEAREQLDVFLAAGGNLIDTADNYSDGDAERILGELLADVPREQFVLLTKSGAGHAQRRLDSSKVHLMRSLEASLQRLALDSVDLWLVHAFDSATPLEEVAGALALAVSSGKAQYVGVSNYSAWQMTHLRNLLGRGFPMVTNEVEYSLLQRGADREVIPAAQALGMSCIGWSPLGRGVLTGKYRKSIPADSRAASPHWGPFTRSLLNDDTRAIVEAVAAAATGLGVAPLEVALAWSMSRPGVCSSLTGSRTAAQLRMALRALDIELPEQIVSALNDVSDPKASYPDAAAQH